MDRRGSKDGMKPFSLTASACRYAAADRWTGCRALSRSMRIMSRSCLRDSKCSCATRSTCCWASYRSHSRWSRPTRPGPGRRAHLTVRGQGGADPAAGVGDLGGVGSVAAGLNCEAGSGMVKESLGGSGSSDVGDWSQLAGVASSLERYSADAGVNAADANRDPTGLGAGCPLAR